MCEGSLRRLRLEQIPLYQFHRPDPRVPLEDSLGALVMLKDQGKIRHIGLSNVTEAQLRAAQQLTPIVSIQNRYNVDDRGSESLVDLCEQEQLVFLPWAPIQDLDAQLDGTGGGRAHRRLASARSCSPGCWPGRRRSCPIPGTGTVGPPRGQRGRRGHRTDAGGDRRADRRPLAPELARWSERDRSGWLPTYGQGRAAGVSAGGRVPIR